MLEKGDAKKKGSKTIPKWSQKVSKWSQMVTKMHRKFDSRQNSAPGSDPSFGAVTPGVPFWSAGSPHGSILEVILEPISIKNACKNRS